MRRIQNTAFLKGILNLKTKTYIGTPFLLQKSLFRDGFNLGELERLANMPIAHIAGPADGVISGFVGEINYPIFLGKDGNIAGTCINASENRMVYVGKSKKDKRLFDRFLSTVRTMETLEFC